MTNKSMRTFYVNKNSVCLSVCTARQVSVMVFDMAAIIHMVRPTRAVTFAEYVSLNVVPFLENQLTSTVKHVDAIWDTYPEKISNH